MRKSLQCPQCEGRKLWRIEQMRERSRSALETEPLAVTFGKGFWAALKGKGSFETFICASCGFTEWYAQGLEELAADPARGVHFIDTEPEGGLR